LWTEKLEEVWLELVQGHPSDLLK